MSAVILQTKTNFLDTAPTSIPVVVAGTTAGALLLVVAESQNGQTVSTVSDGTNTFTKIDGATSTSRTELWYAYNITGLTAPTVTITFGGAGNCAAIVREYSGVTKTDPLDKHVIATVTTSSSPSSGASAAITAAGQLVVGYGGLNVNGAWTAGSGYGRLTTSIGGFHGCAIEDLKAPGATAQTATFTNAQAGSGACGVVSFLTPSGAFQPNNLRPAIFKPGLAR